MNNFDDISPVSIFNPFTTEQMGSWEVITHWDLSFDAYLAKLQHFKQILKDQPHQRFLILCSHPHCFTHGRGLQKSVGGKVSADLVTLSDEQRDMLEFPFYQINRGGGLTYHYPGQFIVYPLVNLNKFPKALMILMMQLLAIAGKSIARWTEDGANLGIGEIKKENFGLWYGNKKVAAIGMGLDRYISEHGMAINLFHDEQMFQSIKNLNPCGLNSVVYTSVEKLIIEKNVENENMILDNIILREKFKNIFCNFLQEYFP